MSTEKLKILDMIQQGKINAEEGLELLKAIEETDQPGQIAPAKFANRFLRVRVDGEKMAKVNVNIPMSLIRSVTRLANIAMAFIPPEAKSEIDRKGINLEELLNDLIGELEHGVADGKLVDVDLDDPNEGRMKVEVFVD